jgi:hypothetical protein
MQPCDIIGHQDRRSRSGSILRQDLPVEPYSPPSGKVGPWYAAEVLNYGGNLNGNQFSFSYSFYVFAYGRYLLQAYIGPICRLKYTLTDVRRSSTFVSLPSSDSGVCDENEKTKPLQSKRGIIYPVSFFMASRFVTIWGWCRLRLCNCARDFWFGIIGLFVGFSVSVILGMLIVNRRF